MVVETDTEMRMDVNMERLVTASVLVEIIDLSPLIAEAVAVTVVGKGVSDIMAPVCCDERVCL